MSTPQQIFKAAGREAEKKLQKRLGNRSLVRLLNRLDVYDEKAVEQAMADHFVALLLPLLETPESAGSRAYGLGPTLTRRYHSPSEPQKWPVLRFSGRPPSRPLQPN